MWSDNETNLDLINVQHLVTAVTGLACAPHLQPLTVGVFGPWGSGKSSVMRMVREGLETQDGVVCVSFNGWLFEGYEDAKAALMGTILDELQDQLTPKGKALELLKHLRERVDWLRLMGMAGKNLLSFTLTGLPSPDTLGQAARALAEHAQGARLDEVKELVKEAPEKDANLRRTVREFRDDFSRLLEQSKVSTLVVLIDDLDRCLPDTVIETLEAIRLFLFVPRTAFVIGADEHLVQHAVKLRFPEVKGSQYDVGRDYLEKLVQVPVRIPPMGRAEVETYINLLFAERRMEAGDLQALSKRLLDRTPETALDVGFNLQTAHDLLDRVPDKLEEDLTLARQVADVLTNILRGNPRQVKRFLNALVLRLTMAEARSVPLKRRVLAKLMLLEEFRPQAFQTLAEWQADQDGQPKEIRALEERLRKNHAAPAEPSRQDGAAAGNGATGGDGDEGAQRDAVVPERAQAWLDGDWLEGWMAMDPTLSGEDLGPYFYFAREAITVSVSGGQRLSRPAKEVLDLFSSPSKAYRIQAAAKAEQLSEADAVSVFQALTDRTRRYEDLGEESSPLNALLTLVEKRPALVGEAVSFLGRLSPSHIPFQVVPRIARISKGTPAATATIALLRSWTGAAEAPMLAQASERELQKSSTEGRH